MIQSYFALGALFVIYLVTSLLIKKRNNNRIISINDKKCVRCNNCVIRCSHGVLEMVHGEEGRMYVVVKNPDRCTACEHCIDICNFGAIRLVDKIRESSL
ncbi:MAG: 4Fe-4S dicluster domain-containing protein [Parabacteroides sp.]|nr:4Fe-4S dicluster domain-containing protein [Parabacteroides sp.]